VLLASATAHASAIEDAAHRVLERVIGADAAAQFDLTLTPSGNAPSPEAFFVSGSDGRIAIQATSASALTQGAGWYLKYVARADLVLRGSRPVLPAVLPAPSSVIHRTASVPHRYALNDTNDGYTDPNLPWEGWENQLDLMALHGINEVYVTVGTDYVFYRLLQKYGYSVEELRRWIPDAAHQPWWVLQNMSGGDFPITESQLSRRADLGRRIADRARELGMTPVFPGYWGTVPVDFGVRNPGADVIAQDLWVGYQRPSWLNPASPLFRQVAADYYAIAGQVLGASTMYKMDPLHEGGLVGDANLAQAATAIELALRTAHPDATWVILGWAGNPSLELLAGIRNKEKLLLLASEADRYPTWDSARRWAGVPYAFGSIYNYGGHTILGANAATMVDRWYSDLAGANSGQLKGVAIFPEAWNANPAVAELLSELPWQPSRFDLEAWLRSYANARYGSSDPHLLLAWSLLAQTAYAIPPDGEPEAQDALFNSQPSLTATTASPFAYGHMRYSGPDLERAWRELTAGAPAVVQTDAYRFDLADLTRQVIVNRGRALLPKIRRAFEVKDQARFTALTTRWLDLMRLADRAEGTHAAFMLGPRLANAIANGTNANEPMQLVRNAVNLLTNWGTEAGFYSGLRDYANRDWNCLTGTYYLPRWAAYFDGLQRQLAGGSAPVIDWYRFGEDFTDSDHSSCATTPMGDIVAIAQEAALTLASGPDASVVPEGWRSFAENEATFGYDGRRFTIAGSGADLWQNVNRYGVLYQPSALRDGVSATVRVAALDSPGNRPWARAGIVAGGNLVSSRPTGFANIAVTPGQGCVFSWAPDSDRGLDHYLAAPSFAAPTWIRLARVGDAYVGSCSKDGVEWTIVGSAVPGQRGAASDVGIFAVAGNGGASDPFTATFDTWNLRAGPAGDRQLAIEYFHSGFRHYFVTALAEEIAKLDAGAFPGWSRTGLGFNVYTAPAAGRNSVCRFFTTAFPPTSSHFYAPRGLGCEPALANADWQFEGDVFFTPLPSPDGACPAGTSPVYRLYNDGQGGAPGHRFTTSLQERASMLAEGYVAEGTGIGVGMCSPDFN
jgi:alpha-N-acetylglucosaminidase